MRKKKYGTKCFLQSNMSKKDLMPVAASKKIQNKKQRYKPEGNSTCGRIKQQQCLAKIFKPKLYICLEAVNLFSVPLTEMEMVAMKGAETDCPRFNPETI